jgi:2-dehydro-3-deoxy-D-arabinonate dehydratase
MTHEVIRFVDQSGNVKVGAREQGESSAHLLAVENLAELLTLEKSTLLSTITEALQSSETAEVARLLPPVDALTEVWAAGVTYKRSRAAREEESDQPDVYSRVYDADRPELFFKSVAWRVVGTGESIGVRSDSAINAPEPEIALVCNSFGEIVGVTICNDVSSRSIEGENPLYLPQAKVYAGSCALGPGFVPIDQIPDIYNLEISVEVKREGEVIWDGVTSTQEMHRTFEDLVKYLFLHMAFPQGVILSTGTGLVPSMSFNLSTGDEVTVGIEKIGALVNRVISASDITK